MRVSYRWMKEFLNFEVAVDEIVERLPILGHEIDAVMDLGLLNNPIRIARITHVEPHPDADNLTICTVDDGSDEPARVVCGAPNVVEGGIGVLARVGASLPNGMTLRRTKIRGVSSEGMLLAPDEMGLGTDHSGILLLDDDSLVGEGYDLILDLEITPNRPDCLNIVGICREIAAGYGRKVYLPATRVAEGYNDVHDLVHITTYCAEDCPRYTARVMRNVKVGPSPGWVVRRLLAAGLRPINNVVDATNLVLVEMGHPLHAFDYEKIKDRQINVRMAKAGERLKLIDETDLPLEAGKDMVIADAEVPVALAGVMGGYDSEVTEKTSDILIESAWFRPQTIRQTARRHGLSTDASYRFERGTDIQGLIPALDRVTEIIQEIAGGEVARSVVDTMPRPTTPTQMVLRADRAAAFLGIEVSKTVMADLLSTLGFEMLRSEGDLIVVAVPSHRVDISCEEDLYEEIARLYGYDRIPSTLPYLPANSTPLRADMRLRRDVQDAMRGMGFNEAVNMSFVSEADLAGLKIETEGTLRLLNAQSQDQSILRPDLTPSLLKNLAYNVRRGNQALRLFETSRTFHFGDMAAPCVEREELAFVMCGAYMPRNWRESRPREVDFFDLKGVLESLWQMLGLGDIKLKRGGPEFLHPGRSALIIIGGEEIGWLGELGPEYREALDVPSRPQLASVRLDLLISHVSTQRISRDLPRHPAIERDLALVVDSEKAAGQVERVIRENAGELLETLETFDCYTGDQIAADKKSLGYRLVYRHPDRTLQDAEADAAQERVVTAVKKELGASLRE